MNQVVNFTVSSLLLVNEQVTNCMQELDSVSENLSPEQKYDLVKAKNLHEHFIVGRLSSLEHMGSAYMKETMDLFRKVQSYLYH